MQVRDDNRQQGTSAGGARRSVLAALWGLGAFLTLALLGDFDPTVIVVVGLVTGLVFSKDRSLGGALRVARDWVGLMAFLLAYAKSRAIADTLGMPVQEQSVIGIDEALGFGETWVHRSQGLIDWSGEVAWWEVSFPLTYSTHFLASMGVLVFLYVRNRPRWKQFMVRWVTLSMVGLMGYILLPTVPPWLASENGTVDIVREGNPRAWSAVGAETIADLFEFGRDSVNPIAAMPSLHAAYPMLLLLFFWSSRGWFGRMLLSFYAIHMGFAIVISGQHWVIDVFAGWACAIATHWAVGRFEQRAPAPVFAGIGRQATSVDPDAVPA